MKKFLLSSEQVRIFSLFFLTLIFTTFGYSQTVITDKDDYAPGEYVIITGSGWEAGEKVTFTFEETPKPESCVNSHDFYTYASSTGEIYYDEFLIKINHIGVSFFLTATGDTSKYSATTTFTDGNVGFGQNGVPGNNIEMVVSVTYTKPNGSVVTEDISFKSNGTSTVGAKDNTVISWSYLPVTINGITYEWDGTSNRSQPFDIGDSNYTGNNAIKGNYISCKAPTITDQPTAKIGIYGNDQTFSVVASGTGSINYEWQVNTGSGFVNLTDNAIYSGVSSSTLNVVKPPVSYSSYQYRARISNDCGEIFSNPATLTVNRKDITGSFTVEDKVYDGLVSATITERALSGILPGDDISLSGGTAAFNDANAGIEKQVTLIGYSLTGTAVANYNLISVSNAMATISKAPSITIVTISESSFIYTGSAIQPATVSVTGAGGLNLSPLAVYTNNINAGTASASYSYEGDENHLPSSDSKTFAIGKADAVVTVTGDEGIYDGQAHGASGSVTGVLSEELSGLDLGSTFTNVPGGTASWTFTDITGNYNDQSGSVAIAISKADAEVTVIGYEGIYDGQAHGASGSVNGVMSEELSGLDLGSTFTNVPGGTANWTFTDITGNYNDQSGSVAIVIAKADAEVTVTGYKGIYDGQDHGASGSVTGVLSEELSGLDLGSTFTNVPGGTANWTFTDITGNYNDQSGSVAIVISKATLTVTAMDETKTYDGIAFYGGNGVSYYGFVNGEDEGVLNGSLIYSGSSQGAIDANNYVIVAEGLNSSNYEIIFINGKLSISKALLTVKANDVSKYCGQANPVFSLSYSGFMNGEDEAVLDTKPLASTTANMESTVDSYPINIIEGSDNNYDFAYENGILTIHPLAIDASYSSVPVQLGNAANLKAKVSPAVSNVRVSFYLNDQLVGNAFTDNTGFATLSLSNLSANVYVVKAVTGNGCDQSEAYLPVYDPNGGFVTGGGWIESPSSAMISGVSGKANFGFNAKYKSGKNNTTDVDGNTNFQFKAGDLNFSSSNHTAMSLVISGAKATYTGEGTINGTGNYEFRVIAVDGELLGNSADQFRIKIWEKGNNSNVIYDNKRGISESFDDATAIGGGSIVIHKPKGKKEAETVTKPVAVNSTSIEVLVLDDLEIAPNPIYDYAEIKVSMLEDSNIIVKLFDLNGRVVRDLYSGRIIGGSYKVIQFDKQNLMSGLYILKVYTDTDQTMEKQLVIK